MKLLIKTAYNGADFSGFQFQPDKRTVQGVLTEVFSALYGFEVAVTGCSRTDSGVHALGFCCALSDRYGAGDIMKIPVSKVHRAANNLLPCDISIIGAACVDDDFHPRYNAAGKEYSYKMYDSLAPSPFLAKRALHLPHPSTDEQIDSMNNAAQYFVGTHNFASFMAQGSKITDPVRTVHYARVSRDETGHISFTVCADGFLYNMVRIMTGTLLDVAEGRKTAQDVPCIIKAKDRALAGATVPPDGLYLNRVLYREHIEFLAD